MAHKHKETTIDDAQVGSLSRQKDILVRMRRCLIVLVCLLGALSGKAAHIIGGEITYTCLGEGAIPNTRDYEFRMIVYRDCSRDGEPGVAAFFDNPATIGIHRRITDTDYEFVETLMVNVDFEEFVNDIEPNPCLILPPGLCVRRAEYTWTVTNLPVISNDYLISYQRCCRNNTIANIANPLFAGAAFSTRITPLGQRECNSSPVFNDFPPTVICANFPYSYDHSATDADGDVLVYRYCQIEAAGSRDGPICGTVPDPANCLPPYRPILFEEPTYTFDQPMAGNPVVLIDSMTGEISGTPEIIGQFVVGVCVEEYRNGVLIGETKRDFQFNVALCEPVVDARIDGVDAGDDLYIVTSCGSRQVDIVNESIQEEFISEYYWELEYPDGTIVTFDSKDVSLDLPEEGEYNGIMAINPGTDCADTANVRIVVTDTISADFSLAFDTCSAGLVNFLDRSETGGNSIETWAWDFGDGTRDSGQIVRYAYPDPGNYVIELTIIDSAGCSSTHFDRIEYFPVPSVLDVEVSASDGCSPLLVQFINRSEPLDDDYLVQWDFGDGSTAEGNRVQHFYIEEGQYQVNLIITSPTGCTDTLQVPTTIEVDGSPQLDFETSYDSCQYGSIDFINLSVADNPIDQIQWDFGDGNQSTDRDPSHTYDEPGRYTLSLMIEDVLGCASELMREIDYFPIPANVSGVIDSFFGCPPFEITFQNTTSPINDEYQILWDFGDGTVVSGDQSSHIYDSVGSFDIQLTVISPIGCADSLIFPTAMEIAPSPVADFLIDTEPCEVGPVDLTDLSSSEVDILSWQWDLGDGTSSTDRNLNYSYASAGEYPITLTIQDERRCIDSITQVLSRFPIPSEMSYLADTTGGCVPLAVRLINSSWPVDSSYLIFWTLGDGSLDTGLSISHLYADAGSYDIGFRIISPSGCERDTIFRRQIEVLEYPIADFSYTPEQPTKLELEVEFINQSRFADIFAWDIDTLAQSDDVNPTFTFPEVDSFLVGLVSTNRYGCADTTFQWIDILPAVNIYVPNVFSPNLDGVNDQLLPYFSCPAEEYEMSIYDRWGNLVHRSQDPTTGWDGFYKGSPAEIGVYSYVISYRLDRLETEYLGGSVTLVR